MYNYSFYNINVYEEGYTDNQNYQDLYYNTLSNQFAHIPSDTDVESLTQDKQDELKKKRMVVPFDVNEAEQYKQAQENAIYEDYPKAVRFTIAVTMACNYQCDYCFEKCKDNKEMSDETLNDIIKYIKNEIDRNPNLKSFSIKWFGGEPLLPSGLNVIRKISDFLISYCTEHNIVYSAILITNGYYLTKDISDELKGYNIKSVQIAIDGFEDNYIKTRKAKNDAFKTVIRNIEDSVIPITIRLNTTRKNKDEIIKLARELSSLKSVKNKHNHIMIARVKEYADNLTFGFTDKEWLEFRTNAEALRDVLPQMNVDRFRLLPCGNIQKRNVIIAPDGRLYRCDFHLGNTEYAVSDIHNGIKQNNQNTVEHDFINSTIIDNCLSCKLLPICCSGLCRYAELKQGKSCGLIEGRFKQNIQNYLNYVYKAD